MFARWFVSLILLLAAAPLAHAQSLGTFKWQLQPFCNVVTMHVVGVAGVYTLEGYDDQCGAPTRAPLTGVATPNPDGTIGFGLNVVATPGGRGVQIDARILLPAMNGPWTDSQGNTGTFVLTPGGGTGGSPRPVAAKIGATAVDSSQVQLRIAQQCPSGGVIHRVHSDGSVTCMPGFTETIGGAADLSHTTGLVISSPAWSTTPIPAQGPGGVHVARRKGGTARRRGRQHRVGRGQRRPVEHGVRQQRHCFRDGELRGRGQRLRTWIERRRHGLRRRGHRHHQRGSRLRRAVRPGRVHFRRPVGERAVRLGSKPVQRPRRGRRRLLHQPEPHRGCRAEGGRERLVVGVGRQPQGELPRSRRHRRAGQAGANADPRVELQGAGCGDPPRRSDRAGLPRCLRPRRRPLRISTIDADGIALAAIQALEARTKMYEARIAALEQQLAALRATTGGGR